MLTPDKPVSVQFGASAKGPLALGRATTRVDKVFGWLEGDRTRQMLVEDGVGFGLGRSAMDLLRSAFYGNDTLWGAIKTIFRGQVDYNWIASRERLLREGSSIFTDNVLSGLAAHAVGKRLDTRYKAYSNSWTDYPTIELFQKVAQESPHAEAFLARLANTLAPKQQAAVVDVLKTVWQQAEPVGTDKQALAANTAKRTELAARLAKLLGKDSFDLKVGDNLFKLDNLLEDLRLFRNQMGRLTAEAPKNAWQTLATDTLRATSKVKGFKMACILLGLAATYAVPYFNAWTTKKLDGINYYPGDIGLEGQMRHYQARQIPRSGLAANARVFNGFLEARDQQPKTPSNRFYVVDSWRKGNRWPALLALLPLPFAAGLFDTVHWKWLKPFGKAWRNALDFGKRKPFTTQQQMGSLFALLITSRLFCSRSDNEYRERLVDSFLMGWTVWIFATPLAKRLAAGWSDKTAGTRLLKEVDGRKFMRTREEIEKLLPKLEGVTDNVVRKTLSRHVWINAASTMATMVILGLFEPLIAMYWSKHNAAKKLAAPSGPQPTGFTTPPPPSSMASSYRP